MFTNLGWTDSAYYEQKLRPLLTQLLVEEARERAICVAVVPTIRQVSVLTESPLWIALVHSYTLNVSVLITKHILSDLCLSSTDSHSNLTLGHYYPVVGPESHLIPLIRPRPQASLHMLSFS